MKLEGFWYNSVLDKKKKNMRISLAEELTR